MRGTRQPIRTMDVRLLFIIGFSVNWSCVFSRSAELPCNFFDSVNITDGHKLNNQSIIFEGIEYPKWQYAEFDYIINNGLTVVQFTLTFVDVYAIVSHVFDFAVHSERFPLPKMGEKNATQMIELENLKVKFSIEITKRNMSNLIKSSQSSTICLAVEFFLPMENIE